jgi:hypothetical protein
MLSADPGFPLIEAIAYAGTRASPGFLNDGSE